MRTFNVLGCTGSIGTQTLDVIASLPRGTYKIGALVAGRNADLLLKQTRLLTPECVAIADEGMADALRGQLPAGTKLLYGAQGVVQAASTPADWSMAAISGMAGLDATLAAIQNSKTVSFASKEMLVAAGPQMLSEVARCGTTLLPVDSEHNAIFQVFSTAHRAQIERIVLTASGGPFRTWSAEQIKNATLEQALKHPNWSMGQKITIDSATLMNKGLEVIEAHHLFQMHPDKIGVLVHPQSLVHGMVEYTDGSLLAAMGPADMRTAIAHTMAWPARMQTPGRKLDITTLSALTFEPVDTARFPAFALACAAMRAGQGACIALNAANEVAVAAFLSRAISFSAVVPMVDAALSAARIPQSFTTIADVCDFDLRVRAQTMEQLKGKAA